MNKNYKSVWNPSTKTWVAVSETSRSKNKKNQTTRSLKKFGQSVVFNALVGLVSFMIAPAWAVECDNILSGAVTFEMTSGNDQFTCGQGDFSNLTGLGGDDNIAFKDTLNKSFFKGSVFIKNHNF